MTTLQIRPMTRAELGAGLDWAADEGWNPGLHDADSFHATDPGGFLLGLLDAEPVSMISAVRYGAGFGFIGFYIVRPAWRGRGHGIAVWRAAMERLAGRTIGLDGVVAQQAAYRRSGFVLAWNNVRYEGVARRIERPGAQQVSIEPLAQASAELLDYDAAFFPDDRRRFVRLWLAQAGSAARAVRRQGRLAGYGVVRPCRSGYKVGPLFADDAELADRLLCALLAGVPAGAPVQLDIPASNPAALELVRAHGMRPVFETARMYTGVAPRLPIARLFGITTFELG
jgi:ribosomal protein S18 acetylase RimI-like enzyme